MRAGIMASGLHIPPPSWHMGYATNLTAPLDLGPESEDRHVALIMALHRTGVTATPGMVTEVRVGDVPLAIDYQMANVSGRIVTAHGNIPVNGGVLTYDIEPGAGIGTRLVMTASWRGAISYLESKYQTYWNGPMDLTLEQTQEGGMGLVSVVAGAFQGWSEDQITGSFDTGNAYRVTDSQPWRLYRPRTSNSVGIAVASTFAIQ